MTHLTGKIYTEKGKHRLTLCSNYIIEGKVDLTKTSLIGVDCLQYPAERKLPWNGLLQTALNNSEPKKIENYFRCKTQPPHDLQG